MNRSGSQSMSTSQHSCLVPPLTLEESQGFDRSQPALERFHSSVSLSTPVMPQKRNSKWNKSNEGNQMNSDAEDSDVQGSDTDTRQRGRGGGGGGGGGGAGHILCGLPINERKRKSSTLDSTTKSEKQTTGKSKNESRKTFMNFLRRGFSLRQKRREYKINDTMQTSAFDALRSASMMQAQFSQYIATDKPQNRLDYLPSSVESSLRPASDTEFSEPNSSSSVEDVRPSERGSRMRPSKMISSPTATNGELQSLRSVQMNQRPPRPTRGSSSRSNSAVANGRKWESSTSTGKEPEELSSVVENTPNTPTNTPRHEVLMRRPRTPTLGRAALLVRAGYSQTDKVEWSAKREQNGSVQSEGIPPSSPISGRSFNRSSSITQGLHQSGMNLLETSCYSTSTLTKDTSKEASIPCSPRFRHPTNPVSLESAPRLPGVRTKLVHNYDAVPDEPPSRIGPDGSSALDNRSTGQMIESMATSFKSARSKTSSGAVRTESNLKPPTSNPVTESEYMSTREWRQHFGHDPESEASEVVQSLQVEPAIHPHQSRVITECKLTNQNGETHQSINVTGTKMAHGGYYEGDLTLNTVTKQLVNTMESKDETSSTPNPEMLYNGKTDQLRQPANAHTSTKSRFSKSIYTKGKMVKTQHRMWLNYHTDDVHPAARHKVSGSASDHRPGEVYTGSITLRRRAKPELENERHRDISLRLSVQEVKQLPSKGRYFCEICLDRTLYARTTSKQSDGTVFWGEKFELNNLPDVSIITINLYKQGDPTKEKRSRSKGQNQFLAFVTIPLKEVPQKSEMQQWLAMQSPHLMHLDQWQGGSNSSSSPGAPRFRKRSTPIACFRHSTSASAFSILNEAVEEGAIADDKPGAPVPTNSRGRKKTSWSAGIAPPDKELVREPRSTGTTTTTTNMLKIGSDGMSTSPFCIGSGTTGGFISPDNGPMPQIRVNLQYEAMDVLPIEYYVELREFIKMHYLDLVRFLEPQLTAKQKEELASCLVNIYEKLSDLSVAELLTELLQEELRQHNDESMIFRSNSTGSKAVECYIKLVGDDYLQQTLKSSIDQLLATSEDFEIDPSRLSSTEQNGTMSPANLSNQVEKNRAALIRHLKIIWRKISSSAPSLPRELREVFSSLSDSLEQSHGSKTAARLISSCLFLRFICPAIHGPVLFGLTTAVPESVRLSRNLTLVAKVLQNLANLATFEEKERHMRVLNPFVETEIPRMRTFLQTISARPTDEEPVGMTDCHKFIDLGYEFAKLTSLLLSYIRNSTLPEELADLVGILNFIDEHTNDAVLSSWTPEMITCRRYTSCNSNGPLLHNRPRFNSTDNAPYPPVNPTQSEQDVFSNCGSTNPLVPKLDDSGLGSQSVFMNGNGSHSNQTVGPTLSTASSSRHASTSGGNSDQFYLPEVSPVEENTEELIVQYQEQLRQLNACIDRVESSEVCPRAVTSHPHVMRVNGHGTPTLFDPTPDPKPPVLGSTRIPGTNQTVAYATRTNRTDELNCISDYEIGDLTERSDEPCHSEPMMDTRGRDCEAEADRQTFMVGSPSLDQLAERLQELRLLLKHERQELEQVVATKTQAIQQQEQSIEQLASELDQLRRAPIPPTGRARPTNGRKWPSGTVSPSSSCSLSSECHVSNHSDGLYPFVDELTGSCGDPAAPVGDSIPGSRSQGPSTGQTGAGVGTSANPRIPRFRNKAWSDRIDQMTNTKVGTAEMINRYGPNLLDLARASEGTGIPLGDLIVPKQSIPIRRRFSESKLLHP